MKKLLVVLCFVLHPMQGMVTTGTKSDVGLTEETTWLVHRTRVFPKNGEMVAGSLQRMVLSANGQGSVIREKSTPLDEVIEQAMATMTAVRNSLHWSVNSLVYPHVMINTVIGHTKTRFDGNRDAYPYIIVENIKAFDEKKLCGYWQDAFHLGGHRLSKDAIILVPLTDDSYKKYVGSFKGTIMPYEVAQGREIVESILREKNAPILYPSMKGLDRSSVQWYNANTRHQDILIKDTTYRSQDISTCLHLDHTVPLSTDVIQLHEWCLNLSLPVRTVLYLSFVHSKLVGTGLEIPTCSGCSTKPKSDQTKTLSACGGCHSIHYCSKACQKSHWPTHKKLCKLLFLLNNSFHNTLNQYNSESVDFCSKVIELRNKSDKAQDHFPDSREKEILKNYQAYAYRLLNYLYSPDKPFSDERKSYNVKTLSGFIRYCKMVRDKVAPLAAKFEGV